MPLWHMLLPDFVRRIELAKVSVVLLNSHDICKRGTGCATQLLCVFEHRMHLRLHARSEMGLRGIDTSRIDQ